MSLAETFAPALASSNGAPRRGRLVLEHISKDFPGSTVPALRDVGPSGCGKSTLLNLVAGMISPGEGRVTLDGQAVSGPHPERTMVFQDHGLFPWLTAAQNIAFGLKMAGVPRAQREERVANALDMIHLRRSAE